MSILSNIYSENSIFYRLQQHRLKYNNGLSTAQDNPYLVYSRGSFYIPENNYELLSSSRYKSTYSDLNLFKDDIVATWGDDYIPTLEDINQPLLSYDLVKNNIGDCISYEKELSDIFLSFELELNELGSKKNKIMYLILKCINYFMLDRIDDLQNSLSYLEQIINDKKHYQRFSNLFLTKNLELDDLINFKILCSPLRANEFDVFYKNLYDRKQFDIILEMNTYDYPFDLEIFDSSVMRSFEEFSDKLDCNSRIITISHGNNGMADFNFKEFSESIDGEQFIDIFNISNNLSAFFCSSVMLDLDKNFYNSFPTFGTSRDLGPDIVEAFIKCYFKGLTKGKSHYECVVLGQFGILYRMASSRKIIYYKNGIPI